MSPECVHNDTRSYYNFASLGNVTLRASDVTEGPYLMAFGQLCPATALRLTFNITFTGGEQRRIGFLLVCYIANYLHYMFQSHLLLHLWRQPTQLMKVLVQ